MRVQRNEYFDLSAYAPTIQQPLERNQSPYILMILVEGRHLLHPSDKDLSLGTPVAGARVDLIASLRDTPTLVSL
jgi:hypothetical protein